MLPKWNVINEQEPAISHMITTVLYATRTTKRRVEK